MLTQKLILGVLLLVPALSVSGQRSWSYSAGNINVAVLETDPDKYKRTVLSTDLIGFDTYLDINVSYNFKLETMLGERIMPSLQIRHSWLDAATSHIGGGYPTTAGGLQKQSITDLGAVYFFHSVKKKASVKVVLSSVTSGRYTTTHSVHVPSEVRRMAGIRGGIFAFRKALAFDENSHSTYHYKSADGLTVVPISNVGNYTYVQPAGQAYMPIAMSHVTCLYGGIHLRNIKHTVIKAEGYRRKKATAKVVDLYFDLMYAPTVTIDNVVDVDKKEWTIVPQDEAIRHLGYRIGYAFHSTRTAGVIFSSEFGKRPGAKMGKSFMDNGTFVTFNMGFSIGSGKYLKLKHEGHKKEAKAEGEK